MAIETQNGDYNLTSAATIYNKTAAADGEFEFQIDAGDGTKNVNTAASVFSFVITCGSQVVGAGTQTVYKEAGRTRVRLRTGRLFVANGAAMTITLLSSNASDTDVDVTVTPRRMLTMSVNDVMRAEAVRQGYREGRDQIVQWADTATGRGVNLAAAHDAAKAAAPTATDWVTVFLPPWVFSIAAGDEWDTDYIHYRALFPERGGDRLPTDDDRSDDTTSMGTYRPPRTQVVCSTNNTTVITQSASTVRMTGFAIAQLSGSYGSTYSALQVSATSPAGSVYDRMYFFSRATSFTQKSVGFAKHVQGLWLDCIANAFAWRVGYDVATEGQFSASMYRCIGGAFSYIGDYEVGQKGTHKATNCYLVYCKSVGSYWGSGSGYSSFAGCAAFANDIDASCVIAFCEGGERSFGLGSKNEALMLYNRGGQFCGGSTVSASYIGEFAGMDIGGIWGAGSLGGRDTGLGVYGKCTGTLRGSVVRAGVAPTRLEGAKVDDCLFTMSGTNQDVFTLLDANSKVHNSTLIPSGTGVGISGNGYSVSAVGTSCSGTLLGTGVTNVGKPLSPTDALTVYDPPTNTEFEARSRPTAEIATPTNITDLQTHGNDYWATANVSGLATPEDIQNALDEYGGATSEELADLQTHGDAAWSGGGATPEEIWTHDDRSLSGSASSTPPDAGTGLADIHVSCFDSRTTRLDARVRGWDGKDIIPAQIESVSYTIARLDPDDPDARTPVEGHTDIDLEAIDVVFDDVRSDDWWANYNFSHTPDITEHAAFEVSGATYEVAYTITPLVGQILPGPRFRVTVF